VHNYVNLDFELVYDYLEKSLPIMKEYAKYLAVYASKKK
jgi:hypothetical protein